MSFQAFIFILIIFPLSLTHAQQTLEKAKISGQVLTAGMEEPMPFATISIFSQKDSLVEGNLSGENGSFVLHIPFGTYYALIEFMGYSAIKTDLFRLSKDAPIKDLGKLSMVVQANTLNEVVVQGEKTVMQLSLDKRIFNVGKDLANAGGSASDILLNLPSIAVDPEGNVRLRGSSNVRILIDGKPSGLFSFKGSSGLRQLPANMVERVEVITNPSAKYEAEGMAGVINIVLKKDDNQGINGSFELITGTPTNLGFTTNLNYRRNRINWFINYGLSRRINPSIGTLYQEVYLDSLTHILSQSNKGTVYGLNNNIRAGLDYYFSEKSYLTFSYIWRRSDAHRITDIRYEDYQNNLENFLGYSLRRQDETEQEPNSEIILNYKKSFPKKGHELNASITYLDYWENSDQVFTQSSFLPAGIGLPQKELIQTSLNDEFEKQYLLQLDYTQPFAKDGKIETGFRTSFRNMENDYVVKEKNANGQFLPLPGLDNIFIYNENILAAYALVANKSKKWSYQAGLRAEYTDVKTTLLETKEVNPRNYANLFPSAHLTYHLSLENALQLSYSRRVRRPVYNDLSPYVTFSDQRNFFSGNPDLNPEFTDAFELGHIKYYDKGTFFSTFYFRTTVDKIERIRSVDDNGFSVTAPFNLAGEQSFGLEFTVDYRPKPWWKMDVNVNFFHAEIDGSNIEARYTAQTGSFLARYTSRFSPKDGWDLQLRGNYEGKQRTAQGIRKSIYFIDFSVNKRLWKDRGSLIFNVLDILNARRNRFITQGDNFYTLGNFQQVVRQMNLTLSYRIKR
jgi:outer membrane receptor protein involved in Fe transport